MKLTFVFLAVGGIIFHLKFGEPKQSLIAQAIQQVIEQHYVKNSVKFELIYNSDVLEVVGQTLKLIKELKDYQISKLNDEDKTIYRLEHSAILIVDSVKNFEKLAQRLRHVNRPKEINMLVYFANQSEIEKVDFGDEELPMFSFLVEENDEIILKSFALFSSQHCRPLRLTNVNKFSRKSIKWTSATFFMTTIRKFHGCPLYFGAGDGASDKTIDVKGATVDLFDSLSSHLNYTVVKVFPNSGKELQKIDHKYSSVSRIDDNNYLIYDISTPVETSSVVVAVPPGEPYSPIEILFRPFDLETWIWFTIVFVVAFSVTVFIKLSKSRMLSSFVVGENVASPGLNIFGIFMGIGMILSVPPRSISRFLLMNFILFSLIMRTAYQGKYFEFMTKVYYKREIQTVEELIEKNYTIYIPKDWDWEELLQMPYLTDFRRLNYVKYQSGGMQKKLYNDLQSPSFRGCTMEAYGTLKKAESDSISFRFLQKPVITFNFGIGFKRYSFLSPIFLKKIDQIVTGGLFDEWGRLFDYQKDLKRKKLAKPYDTVLTMQHLSIGFYIWLLMCLLSACAFVGEFLIYWAPKISRMWFFYYILSRFYKMQHSMH